MTKSDKEIWEMTRAECGIVDGDRSIQGKWLRNGHKNAVYEALMRDDCVPNEVLAEYPDLAELVAARKVDRTNQTRDMSKSLR